MKMKDLTIEQLAQLRKDIVLNSIYVSDYENRFDIDKHIVCDFFDGFMSYCEELEKEEFGEDSDMSMKDFFEKYDTIDNLVEWYYMHEEFGDEEFDDED